MTAVSQALAGMVDMSSPEYTHDLMNEIINSILVEDNHFIWNFSYNKNANTDMNISVDGNKRCPVISIDGEIMGTPSGVPDFLHISEDNSLDLPAEIRNNPLFAKNLSLILHLHRLQSLTSNPKVIFTIYHFGNMHFFRFGWSHHIGLRTSSFIAASGFRSNPK